MFVSVFEHRAEAQCGRWSRELTSPSVPVAPLAHSAVTFDDGTGPKLYVGQFGAVYRLNGSAWEFAFPCSQAGYAMRGVCAGTLGGVALLFAAESDVTAPLLPNSNVWSFDGATPTPLGTAPFVVKGLELLDDGSGPALFAYGTNIVAVPARGVVARWDGTAWNLLGAATLQNRLVESITMSGVSGTRELYACGPSNSAAPLAANVVRWNGTSWIALPTAGTGETALSLASVDFGGGERLYAGFATSDPTGALRSFDGTTWTDHGLQGAEFSKLEVVHTPVPKLLVGGKIITPSGGFPGILAFDGASLLPHAPPLVGDSVPFDLASYVTGSTVHTFAIGKFTRAGSTFCNGLAEWDGATWSTIGRGLYGGVPVNALTRFDFGSGPELVAAGVFSGAGAATETFTDIARWDGERWASLGAGSSLAPSGSASAALPQALVSANFGSGPLLFAGGRNLEGVANRGWLVRTQAGWSALENGEVRALCAANLGGGMRVYAGGSFTNPLVNVLQFDGTRVTTVGAGTPGQVNALTLHDAGGGARLYAGGSFTAARAASWNGTTWSPLGIGVNGEIYALASFGGYLWAGGAFTTAGGNVAQRIARWNGSVWTAVPAGGADGIVRTLLVHDDGRGPALFVGGDFTFVGNVNALGIARFDGTSWSTVDDGVDAPVLTLAAYDDDGDGNEELYAGGWFSRAGSVLSGPLARLGGCSRFTTICSSDGSTADHVTTCPCGNVGATGHGCANSVSTNGALLAASGSTQLDTVVLDASDMPSNAFAVFLQHTAAGDALFHDGVICAVGTLLRLRSRPAAGGASRFPDTTFAQDATTTLAQRAGITPGSGVVRYYSTFYRNAAATFCPPATANVSNGIRILW